MRYEAGQSPFERFLDTGARLSEGRDVLCPSKIIHIPHLDTRRVISISFNNFVLFGKLFGIKNTAYMHTRCFSFINSLINKISLLICEWKLDAPILRAKTSKEQTTVDHRWREHLPQMRHIAEILDIIYWYIARYKTTAIEQSQKSHNALDKNLTMHHFGIKLA